MAGAYCRFCDHRCFVHRELPDRSWAGHLATCTAGAAHDRDTLGYDHNDTINPIAVARLLNLVHEHTALTDGAQVRQVVAVLLRGLADPRTPRIDSARYPIHIRYLEEGLADHATG